VNDAAASVKGACIHCSLKSANGREKSSTDVLLKHLLDALETHGAGGEVIRAVDYNIKPGVTSDEGEGDAWPMLRKRVLDADILVIGTPIWLGQPSSVAKRVLERMDAFLDETDAKGRMPSYGKVALGRCRQRGRRPSYRSRIVSGSPGSGLYDPGRRCDLLGRRGHGEQGLQGFVQDAKGGCRMDAAPGIEHRASGAPSQAEEISRRLTQQTGEARPGLAHTFVTMQATDCDHRGY
jgi:hypothetical protein